MREIIESTYWLYGGLVMLTWFALGAYFFKPPSYYSQERITSEDDTKNNAQTVNKDDIPKEIKDELQ